jgi:exopolyphosphatase/guanosine-5'-triphosphate,3'-diphosphate pyrophosphatase
MTKPARPPSPRQLAAVDLGSNSFHHAIARSRGSEVRLIDRVREPVRLASGLGKRGSLKKTACTRALKALERLGQRVRDIPPECVRAVGTSTLRLATNAAEFLVEAEDALGHPIEIISGREEGRLIYLGVAHSVPAASGSRLVVDIGGGSTECILGVNFEATRVDSLNVGCVQLTGK